MEQLILRNKQNQRCLDIAEGGGGLNFQFSNYSDAGGFSNFIQKTISCRTVQSKQQISHNEQEGTINYKYSIMIELAPVCREDLVILPKHLAKDLGGIGPMVLVYKISKFIHIVDILTMQTFEVDTITYWKNPFKAVITRERLTEFVVLDIEEMDTNMNDSRAAIKQRFKLVKL
jgi:nonsense-mediated mRNA decay protein 3